MMKRLLFLLFTIIVQFFYCQTNVSIYQSSGIIEQDSYNLNQQISLPSQVLNSGKPSSGFELNFSWGANNGSRLMRPGGGDYTPMATFGIVVNGYKVWEARTPPDSNTESGDNATYNGAYFISGTTGVWPMQSFASLINTATIRLPSSINTIQSIYLVGSTGSGGSGGDDFILQLNTVTVGAPLCLAGTTAPALSVTSISNVCPSTVANLTMLSASNQPSGTSITWHTGATASDSNKIGNPNAVTSGTYYASFYDAAGGCYSPTTAVTVTINNCVDTDGDGIYDDVDVDDDNDGILDTVELSSCTIPNKSTITATSGISWSGSLSNILDNSNADVIYSSTNGTSITSVNYLTFQFPQAIALNAIELACHPTGILTPGSLIKVQGSNNGTTWTDLSGNISTGMSTGIVSGATTAENFSFSNSTSYTYYRLYGVSGSTIWWYLREANFRAQSSSCDLDGDGIPNDKDLDSDNDGCLDAMEGGATIALSQLVSAGGTASVGTGSSASPKNICASSTCVSTSGINIGLPQFATLPTGYSNTTGQTIGDAQNASVNSQCTVAMLDAQNDINQTPIGVTSSGNVITNDSVTDGSTITVQSATYLNAAGVVTPLPLGSATNVYDANHVLAGSMTLNSNGTYTFVPSAGYSGTVPVSYTAVSSSGSIDSASLSIEVVGSTTSGNDKPIAQNDTASSESGTSVSSNVLLNDSDPDGNPLTVTSATSNGSNIPLGTVTTVSGVDANGNAVANAGTLTLNSNGTYTFVPAAGFTGYVNPISYTVSDGNGGTDSATIAITILPNIGNSVYANDDAASAPRGTTISATAAQGLLANDTDPEGNTMSVTSATANGSSLTLGSASVIPNVGTITINSNGSYTFVPLSSFVGTLPVTYTVCDNGSPQACDTATLYVTSLSISETNVCYKPAVTSGTALDTNHGITALGRAGADNSNWPMVRKGGWTALEAKTKGFVVNRLTDAQVAAIPAANLKEGMMVYNITQDCLQINIDGTVTGWKCYNTQACPEIVSPVQLNCSSATFSPSTMVSGAAYTGTLTIPYTNGDATPYTSGNSISSTGVTGLTATLRAGTLANGAGNLVYDVTGTPSTSGIATFPITFNGKSCNINVVVNDELSSNSIFINVDQESFYSGGIGLYSTFAVDFYGLPATYNGSDYNITVNGITIKRSELYAGFRFYPLSCIAQSGNTCLRSGTYTAALPNGKELSVTVTAPSQAPSMPSGSNSSRRQVCTDNGPDLPSAPYDGVCNNYNVN